MMIQDHEGNYSNAISLPAFVYGVGDLTVCYDDALTISFDECAALVAFYEDTDGENWSDQTGWLSDPDVSNWFGLIVAG